MNKSNKIFSRNEEALTLIRHAQCRWDWVSAADGLGFHSPAEALRVLGTSVEKVKDARKELALVLVKLGMKYPVKLTDISTKAKAQEVIVLDMVYLNKDKQEFLNTKAKEWDKAAKERQGTLIKY